MLKRFAFAAAALALAACQGSPSKLQIGAVEIVEAGTGVTDVAARVRDELAKTDAAHRRLVVYVGATWCEPCQQLHDAILAHKLDAQFPDLTLLEFDLDRDARALEAAGYTSELIPLLNLPGPDGRATPKKTFGGKHGIDNAALLANKLRALLN